MMYEFSITDTYNYKKERIMEDALIAAQEEFDFLGIKERPSVELVSESTSNNCKIYNFIAKKALAPISSNRDNEELPSKSEPDSDTAAALPVSP